MKYPLSNTFIYISFWLVLCACNSPKIRVSGEAFNQKSIDTVSIVSVLENPGVYHQKILSIEGFLSFGFEMSAIFLDQDTRGNLNFENAIWVIPAPSFTKVQLDSIEHSLNNKRVRAIGKFNAALNGHLGYYNGTLEVFYFEQL